MSERIRKGGIRRNPAVEGITDDLRSDRKGRIVQKMKELLLTEGQEAWNIDVPIDFNQAAWRKGRS